ncbi:MAG: cyanophycin synthetase [Chloroflexota bacterium]
MTQTCNIQPSTIDDIIRQYRNDEQWLLSLIRGDAVANRSLSREARLEEFRNRFQNCGRFLDFADNPQNKFRSVHVAGTSGKGSVTLMMSALLKATGQRIGDHISPYLQICNEKLRINGEMIAPSQFSEIIGQLRDTHTAWVAQGESIRYGSAWVALTFLWFAHMQMDWGVIETGMGGRLNATNLTPSDIAIITNVDYDHMISLGPTLVDIAWHKAGIIKPGKMAVTAETKPEALQILHNEAREKEARLFEIRYEINTDGSITVDAPHRTYANIFLSSNDTKPGRYHCENAATSITAFDLIGQQYGFSLTDAQIQQALNEFTLPGRMEVMQQEPLVVLDGAHNPHKMASLIRTLKQQYPTQEPILIFGMLDTKVATDVIDQIAGYCHRFIVAEPHVYQKTARPCSEVAELIKTCIPNAMTETREDVQDALDLALENAGSNHIIVVTGSVYLVGEARERWYPKQEILRMLERRVKSEE